MNRLGTNNTRALSIVGEACITLHNCIIACKPLNPLTFVPFVTDRRLCQPISDRLEPFVYAVFGGLPSISRLILSSFEPIRPIFDDVPPPRPGRVALCLRSASLQNFQNFSHFCHLTVFLHVSGLFGLATGRIPSSEVSQIAGIYT